MSGRANSRNSHKGSLKSGKSVASSRSKSPSKSVKMSRSASAAGSTATSDGGKKAGSTTEVIDENGFLHIDMNNQGLTAIASTVFDRQNVVSLDLGCNNLRNIPPSINKLRHLTKLSVSKNSIRCTHAHDFSGLPMEISSLTCLVDLDVSECNFPHVPPAIWHIPNLRELNISRNKINMLVPEVGNLMKLRHLNAQLTNISTLPPEIAFCQELEVLLLFGNVIDSLPETLRELPSLHTLAINYQSFCSIFDAYDMDDLLMKGQIPSEHIPQVLFEIPSLRVLNFEETKINTLPDKCSARLEEFYLQRNFLARVPSMVPNILTLKVLDMSNNFLPSIPEEIGQLRALETFSADNNKIEVMPTSIGHMVSLVYLSMGGNKIDKIPPQIGNLEKLKSLVLDRNNITEIPETIVKLVELETLDLSSNKISSLPICFYKMVSLVKAHTYDKLTKTGLWLHLNPITIPPQDIWKSEDPQKIYTYLRKLEIMKTENLQRQKLIILGDAGCGKTSLLNTMMTQKSNMTDGIEHSTKMLEYSTWMTDNEVSFMVLDMGGHQVYRMVYPMFLDPTSVYLLVYDHRRYTTETHHATIGFWLDLLQIYAPGAIVKIIGTQCDNICAAISKATLEVVKEEIDKQLAATDANLQKEFEKIELMIKEEKGKKNSIKADHLKKQRKKIENLRTMPLRIHGDITLVSSDDGIPGVMDLIEELEYLAVDKILRPQAQRFIPDSWKNFCRALKLQKDYCLPWNQLESIAKKHNVWGNSVEECIRFYVETGEFLWFRHIPDLKDKLFHNPRKLVQVLNCLFRHDLDTFLKFPENLVFTSKGQFSNDSFIEAKEALTKYGQISRSMLLCLWFYLRLDYDNFNLLCDLMPQLDLCYHVPQPDIPLRPKEFLPLIVIPWYNVDQHPTGEVLLDMWPKVPKPGHCELKMDYYFPVHFPQGLFEKLACRIHNAVFSRLDWQDLIIATTETSEDKEVQICLHRHLDLNDYTPVLSVRIRSEFHEATSQIMKAMNQNICSLLKEYQGMVWYFNFTKVNFKEATIIDCFPEGTLSK